MVLSPRLSNLYLYYSPQAAHLPTPPPFLSPTHSTTLFFLPSPSEISPTKTATSRTLSIVPATEGLRPNAVETVDSKAERFSSFQFRGRGVVDEGGLDSGVIAVVDACTLCTATVEEVRGVEGRDTRART
jgi:hypothetical protein